jgi:hypothetical protein
VRGGWRRLHNEELCNWYSSPSIIRMTKSWRIGWERHVAWKGIRSMHLGCYWEIQKERDNLEDQEVGA